MASNKDYQVVRNNAIIAASYAEEAPISGSQRRHITQALYDLINQRDEAQRRVEELEKELAKLKDELDKQ